MAEFDSVAIVGVGLIGGSIGQALRERKLAREVVGIGRQERNLRTAEKLGAIDRGTTVLAEGVAQAEIVVICTPVDTVAQLIVATAAACPARTIISDVGSTKEAIVTTAEAALASRRNGPWFVGSHPLAGDHRRGVGFSRGDLFERRKVIVTSTDTSHRAAVMNIVQFWQNLGAAVVEMGPAEHDDALAVISHLPHLVASALAYSTPKELLPLAASGWRYTTRIAGGDPALWRAIVAANRQHVLDALVRFDEALAVIREALEQGDDEQLFGFLERAKWVKSSRDALGD